jgi:hypothetical protein
MFSTKFEFEFLISCLQLSPSTKSPHNIKIQRIMLTSFVQQCRHKKTCTYTVLHAEYSETCEIRTPLAKPKVPLIQRCPHFRVQFALRKAVWDHMRCPYFAGRPQFAGCYSQVSLYYKDAQSV